MANSDFARPPKSTRRSVTPPQGGLFQSITDSASQVYANAPDLGIQSTAGRAFGYGSSTTDRDEGAQNSQMEHSSSMHDAQHGDSSQSGYLDARDISRKHGPSSQERVGKSQMEVGTEYGIPTRAGAGTTVSPDKTNQLALERSHSSNDTKPRQAYVPEDYAPEPCPEDNAGTGKIDSEIQKILNEQVGVKTSNYHPERNGQSQQGKQHSRQTSANSTHNGSKRQSGHGTPKSTASSDRSDKRRSLGHKLRDQIKGEMKILSGSFTNNNDKIIEGLNIKHGEA